MASSSSSLLPSIPISFPSTKQWNLKSSRPSLRASATPTQKARFVGRRKESVSVRQLQRPLSNVRQMLINYAFDYSISVLVSAVFNTRNQNRLSTYLTIEFCL